jgi:Ca2+-transporting ATPase
MLLLIIAAAVAWAIGHSTDAIGILLAVALSVGFGFAQEYKAEEALGALQKLAAPKAKVLREGKEIEVPASEVVPGDIIVLREGDLVPADARLLKGCQLRVDQSLLSGESIPVEKNGEWQESCKKSIPVFERANIAYAGTQVVWGGGKAVVYSSGISTEFGKIAKSLAEVKQEPTPLQKKLEELGGKIGKAAIGICAIFFIVGVIRGEPAAQMLLSAVALAVAAIPEGLPTILAITLGLGVQRMAAKKALIRKLQAVETLGSATVICTDKTGTLTANKISVVKANLHGIEYIFKGGPYDLSPAPEREDGKKIDGYEKKLISSGLEAAVLCNEASVLKEKGSSIAGFQGDPTEGALLIAAIKAGIDIQKLKESKPKIAEISFDYDRKMMTQVRRDGKKYIAYSKGAPEKILQRCSMISTPSGVKPLSPKMRSEILRVIHSYSKQALRTIALAKKEVKAKDIEKYKNSKSIEPEKLENNLVWIGIIGMMDPPRQEVAEVVHLCKQAGIRVIMITGDSPATAEVIACQIGILDENECKDEAKGGKRELVISGEELEKLGKKELEERLRYIKVLARATPEHKFLVVRTLQKMGEVVAVTGDGVNDAPSIKAADIGVAMGLGGTDVARGAADMVLTDNNFSSLVHAIEAGRSIYENIRSFVRFQLTTNIAALSLMFTSPLIGLGLPLMPLQILWINIIMDGPPALALGVEPPRDDAMNRPPRPKNAPFVSKKFALNIAMSGFLMFLLTLFIYANYHQSWDADVAAKAGTMAFVVFVILQLVNAFNCRSSKMSAWHNLTANRWLLLAAGISLILQIAIIYMPPLQAMFKTVGLDIIDWGIVVLAGAIMLAKEEIIKRAFPSLTDY